MEDKMPFSYPPAQSSAVPSWIIFVAGLLSALMLFLAGVALGYISIRPLSQTTETSTSAQNQSATSTQTTTVTPGQETTNSATTDETAGWKTYSDSTLGFSVKYPSSWLVTEGNSYAPSLPEEMVTFQSRKDVFDISVIVEDTTYSSKKEAITQFVKNSWGSYDLSSKTLQIGSYEGLESFFIQSGMGGSQLKLIYTVLENNGRFYYVGTQTALNSQTNEPEDTERLEIYNNVLSTFKFLD